MLDVTCSTVSSYQVGSKGTTCTTNVCEMCKDKCKQTGMAEGKQHPFTHDIGTNVPISRLELFCKIFDSCQSCILNTGVYLLNLF